MREGLKLTHAGANQFHKIAWKFMRQQGFTLINDPKEVHGLYNVSRAMYRSKKNFYLEVGFEPGDSNSAGFFCGRQWSYENRIIFLSNYYSVLAKTYGVEVPLTYNLGYGDEAALTIKRMFSDLRGTLPLVLDKVTLEDLIFVEKEKFGAAQKAQSRFGLGYARYMQISEFT